MSKVNKSLIQPNLLGGIERINAIILGFLFLALLMFGNLNSKIFGTFFILIIWATLVFANKADYIFFKVLIRHLRQKNNYKAIALKKFYNKNKFIVKIKD